MAICSPLATLITGIVLETGLMPATSARLNASTAPAALARASTASLHAAHSGGVLAPGAPAGVMPLHKAATETSGPIV